MSFKKHGYSEDKPKQVIFSNKEDEEQEEKLAAEGKIELQDVEIYDGGNNI